MKKETYKSSSQLSDLETKLEIDVFAHLSGHLDTLPVEQMRITSLEQRLTDRIQESIAKHASLKTVRAREGVWRKLTSGIRYKTLWQSVFGNSVLIEIAAGAALPIHRHHQLEEGIVLSGSLQVDDLVLTQFDYHVSPAGSHHGKIGSKDGGLAFLRGSSVGDTVSMATEVLGGLLPKAPLSSSSIKMDDSGWEEISTGFFQKELWSDGETSSKFYRLEPDVKLPGHDHPLDEECFMLSGDLFLGDILLQAGDYQVALKGSRHYDIYTDTGALLFVRGAA